MNRECCVPSLPLNENQSLGSDVEQSSGITSCQVSVQSEHLWALTILLCHNSCQILRFSAVSGLPVQPNVFFLLMIYGPVSVSFIFFLRSWVGKWSLEHAKPLWLTSVSLVPGEGGFLGCSTQVTKENCSQLALTKKSGVKISQGQICKPLTAEAKPGHINGAAVWTSTFFQADKRTYMR